MNKSGLMLVLIAALMWAGSIRAADIKQRTAIVCVFEESRSLTSFDSYSDSGKPGKIRSYFTQWLFSDDESSRSSEIRFLWTPESPNGPRLNIESRETHHVLIRLMSQTRDSLLATSSASDVLTAVGWLFSINFKLEQVMASSVRSNPAGMKSQAVKLSCTFDNETPQVDKPASGSDLG